jgi:hypothetical protein
VPCLPKGTAVLPDIDTEYSAYGNPYYVGNSEQKKIPPAGLTPHSRADLPVNFIPYTGAFVSLFCLRGRELPNDPRQILPRLVRLSPFPILIPR